VIANKWNMKENLKSRRNCDYER